LDAAPRQQQTRLKILEIIAAAVGLQISRQNGL
jgi:hypothetical protein